MRRVLRFLVAAYLVALGMLVGSTWQAYAQTPPSLTGVWGLAGTEPDGSTYGGAVAITPHGQGYRLEYEFDSGGRIEAYGVWDGDVLASVFITEYGAPGVASFRLTKDGDHWRLTGPFLIPPSETEGSETLTKTTYPTLEAWRGRRAV